MGHEFHPAVLREYYIRGIVGGSLTADDAAAIGRSFGTAAGRGGGRVMALGRDGRLSSPAPAAAARWTSWTA